MGWEGSAGVMANEGGRGMKEERGGREERMRVGGYGVGGGGGERG